MFIYHVSLSLSCTFLLLQAARPRAIVDLVRSAERLRLRTSATEAMPKPGTCSRCGYLSSQEICKACVLLEGLNRGLPRLGVSRTRKKGLDGRAGLPPGLDMEHGCASGAQGTCSALECSSGGTEEEGKHAYLESKVSIPSHPSARFQNL